MQIRRLISLSLTTLCFVGLAQAQQQCLHNEDENQSEKARIRAVVTAVRILNTAEIRYRAEHKKFGTLDELLASTALNVSTARNQDVTFQPNTDVVPGFELRVTTDGTKYNISVLDKTDPCKYTVFSTDMGIIYQGYPIP
jgi:hypothetical protein